MSYPRIMPKPFWLLLALTALVACSATATPQPTPSAATPTSAPAPVAAPVTVTLWHTWTGRSAQTLDALARAFEQQQPDIRISLQTHAVATLVRDYTAQAADATAPQIILLRGRYLGELAARQVIVPLDAVLSDADREQFIPAALASGQWNNQQYGLPMRVDGLVFWHDRRNLPTPPTTLTDLAQLPLPTPTSGGSAPLALAYHLSLTTALPYLAALGGQLVTAADPVAFATSGYTATTRWLRGLQALATTPQVLVSDDLGAVDRVFQAGRAASALDWSYRWEDYAQVWGAEQVGAAPLPALTPGSSAPPTVLVADVLCLNTVTTEAQRTAATAFVRFLVSAEAQTTLAQQGGGLPAQRQATVAPPLQAVWQALQSSQGAMPLPALDERGWAVLDALLRSAISDTSDPAAAINRAAQEMR